MAQETHMISLSISIMAVPSREEHVNKMITRLRYQIFEAQRQSFNIKGPDVHWDTELKGPWDCWRKAWDWHKCYDSTHHVILQDDLLFCADLPQTLCRMAQARPEDMISGFLPRKSVIEATEKDRHWVRTRRFLWAQCVLMPTVLGDSALAWVDEHEEANKAVWRRDDDVRISSWLISQGRPVYVAVPHPVEHIGDELGSVMKHNFDPKKRRAKAWLGEEGLGVGVDWSNLAYIRE
jgi:hypothetical protein